jgi:hypothetical protein
MRKEEERGRREEGGGSKKEDEKGGKEYLSLFHKKNKNKRLDAVMEFRIKTHTSMLVKDLEY